MLKWAKPNQRRASECSRRVSECSSDASLETCSNLSSDSSESGITVPIRYHERRTSRPKSLALSSTDVLDLDQDHPLLGRAAHRTGSSPMVFTGCSRGNAKRHSMIVSSTREMSKLYNNSDNSLVNNNNNVLKISTNQQEESESDVLKISTADCDKPKSRNSFWKNLRAKAQGKKSEKKLEKANSMSNIPDLSQQQSTDAYVPCDPTTPTNEALSTTCPSPIVMRKREETTSHSKTKANVMRRRSFKLIKKQNENKKPKPFTKATDTTDGYPTTDSPDSGISSRGASVSSNADSDDYDDGDSPLSPITPINVTSDSGNDMNGLRQQFTSVVLQYLNERLEKKGYDTIIDRSSSTSSNQSDDGAPDIFCYDTDTVARRPSHEISRKHRVQVTH